MTTPWSNPASDAAFDEAARVADAVLFEGYLLYPYRASARKNQLRWQFGVLMPPGYAGEPAANRTECLLEAPPDAVVRVRLRFLRLRTRTVHDPHGRELDELEVAGQRVFGWEEGVPCAVDATFALTALLAGECTHPFTLPAELSSHAVAGGEIRRACRPLAGRLVASAVELPGPYGVLRLRLTVHNDSGCPPEAERAAALRTSLIAAHSLLGVRPGTFLSATDPPEWAKPATAQLTNQHTWPILTGPLGRADVLLSSPIILADHPQLAPESPTELFDGTEIDEILSLRTLVLTDEEKAEARATDPRAAAVIDAVDGMPPEIWARLHGAVRTLEPPAQRAEVRVGDSVRLRPGRGGDAQDGFLTGMRATVRAVLQDVDGRTHVAVTVDADPAAQLQIAQGRYRYFGLDELEPVPR